MKQVATTATFTYTQRQPSESVEVNERKKRRKEKKSVQNTKTNILYSISLCVFPFPLLLHLVHFFSFCFFLLRSVFCSCFFSFLHLKIWNDGWWCADTRYRYTMWMATWKRQAIRKATKKSWSNTHKIMSSVCMARWVSVPPLLLGCCCCCWLQKLTKSFNLLIFHNGQRISNASNAICLLVPPTDCIHRRNIRCKDKHYSFELTNELLHRILALNDKRMVMEEKWWETVVLFALFFFKFSTSSPFAIHCH